MKSNKKPCHSNQAIGGNMMQKTFLQSMIAIVILFFSVSAQAQPLWGPTTSGMSPSEVINLVGESYHIGNGDTLGTGAEELVRVDNFLVVNESFKVSFFFINDRLTQVMLSLNEERSFSESLLVFDSLTETLRAKYGNEISRDVDSRSLLKEAKATWMSGRTNIGLMVVAMGDFPAHLNINYQTRLSTEADKL